MRDLHRGSSVEKDPSYWWRYHHVTNTKESSIFPLPEGHLKATHFYFSKSFTWIQYWGFISIETLQYVAMFGSLVTFILFFRKVTCPPYFEPIKLKMCSSQITAMLNWGKTIHIQSKMHTLPARELDI